MSTIDPKPSKVKHTNRYKDFDIDVIDDVHIRIMKLFPMCHEKELGETDYRRFHMRFYIPREIYQDRNSKVNKLFILFNGLDELYDYTLYDQLGQGLAKHGYGAVLLPLPNHLNRNGLFRFDDKTKKEIPSNTFIEEKEKIYEAYMQIISEVKFLVGHLKHDCTKANDDKCDFYKHLFDKNLRISLLGYSLGGLAALSNFLLFRNMFNSCILLNSGAKLEDIDISSFSGRYDEWKNMLENLHKDWEKPLDNSEEALIFEKIFLGNDIFLLRKYLKESSRKILFILGGADTVNRYKSIMELETEGHGLSVLKLPEIHHFPSIDTEWNKWFKIVINMIAQFDESAYRDAISYNDIFKDLIFYQIKYKIFDGCNKYCVERITDDSDRFKFDRLVYIAEGIFGSMNTAIADMYLFVDKMKKRENLMPILKDFKYKNLFGAIAIKKFNLSEKIIREILKIQREAALKKERIPKFGELLVNGGHLNADQVQEILRSQCK